MIQYMGEDIKIFHPYRKIRKKGEHILQIFHPEMRIRNKKEKP